MIEASNVSKVFSADSEVKAFEALNSVSLTIEKGKFVSIVGPTGCGKSTLLELLAGLQVQTAGEILIDGEPVLDLQPGISGKEMIPRRKYRFLPAFANSLFRNRKQHKVAMIFQDYSVFPWMTARQNILFTLRMRGVGKDDRDGMACHYLQMVGLEDSALKYPAQMSGGMRQRLALARVISFDPQIILMDEPFAAVDALTREKLQDDLLQIWSSTAKTILLVTHDLQEAAYLSDEILVFSASPGTILKKIQVRSPRPRQRLSAEMNDIRSEIQELLSAKILNQ